MSCSEVGERRGQSLDWRPGESLLSNEGCEDAVIPSKESDIPLSWSASSSFLICS